MTDFVVSIRGLAELESALEQAPQDIATTIEQANTAAAPVLAGNIARETPVRSGFLVGSESAEPQGHEVVFRAAAFYASFVHDGTSRQRANPFADRGVTNAEDEVVQVFEREVGAFAADFAP